MNPNHLPGIVLDEDNWDKKPDVFTQAVDKGRKGMSAGFENGLSRINQFLYGTHRGRYYLIGADSGVGKTTLADFMFVIWMWLDCKRKGIPIKIVYLSFELSKREKIARWVSTFCWFLYGLDIPSDYIMGRIPGLLVSEDHQTLIRMAKRYVDQFLKDCEIIEGGVHPTWVLNHMIEVYEGNPDKNIKGLGKVIRDPVPKGSKAKGFIRGYIPHDPQQVVVKVCDHLALGHEEKGASTLKAIIDKFSVYDVVLRNTFDTTIVNLQQFATDLMSTHRSQKKGDSVLAPQRIDFGDSKYTYRDADVVFGLVSPSMFDEKSYKKYDITELMNYFLALHLMKNRHGPAARMIPLFMNPIAGIFEELPKEPTNMIAMEPFYKKVAQLESIITSFSPKTIEICQ